MNEIPAALNKKKVRRALLMMANEPLQPAHEAEADPLTTLAPLCALGLVEKRPYIGHWAGRAWQCNEIWLTAEGKALAALIGGMG